jgi:hypothetical protein
VDSANRGCSGVVCYLHQALKQKKSAMEVDDVLFAEVFWVFVTTLALGLGFMTSIRYIELKIKKVSSFIPLAEGREQSRP